MKTIRFILTALLIGLFSLPLASQADDIDIYSAVGSAGIPNVLLVFDNAANFSSSAAGSSCVIGGVATALSGTVGGIEQCALYSVIESLPDSTVNIGLMVYNANNIRDINNSNCGGPNGGCLMVPLQLMSSANKTAILAWIKTWKTTGGAGDGYIKSAGEATAAAMQESWAYYKGTTGMSGRDYSAIKPGGGCAKNFVVFVGNSYSSSGTPGDGGSVSPKDYLVTAGATAAQQALILTTNATTCGSYTFPSSAATHENGGYLADEWARFMYQADLSDDLDGVQSITSYTIGVLGASCQAEYASTLTSMAKYGGGKYFPTTDYDQLKQALLTILNEVQAVNSVFASASLPVSVNTQGTYLNQVYMGMFRPDGNAYPRWQGNLKQYKFIRDASGTLTLGDSLGTAAISAAGTGFISPDAVSYWTTKNTAVAPDSTGGYWINNPQSSGAAFDSPDGELVEKGGSAQQLRIKNLIDDYAQAAGSSSNPRALYTYCPGGASCNVALTNAANAFAVSNTAITDALLGSSSASSVPVTSLDRVSTTVTVSTSPTAHGFSTGATIAIAGADQTEYNGNKTITKITNTSFSYSVIESPPSPALGSYSAGVAASPQLVTSLTRSGTTATASLTAHGYTNGQSVSISGATQTEYNGTYTITKIDNDRFSFPVVAGPATPAGAGTVSVGGVLKGTIAAYNANPNSGIVRTANSTSVTLATTANHGITGTVACDIAGVKDASGNVIAAYNGSFSCTKTAVKGLSYSIVATTPAATATGSVYADSGGAKTITTLTRSGTTATATATAHGFSSGNTIPIGGTTGTNEEAYVGSFAITKIDNNTFTYPVTVTPSTPATGNMTASLAAVIDRTSLINWVRGQDNAGDELSPGTPYTVRPSIHGDVLHSRPVVLNYGGTSNKIVVYYGTNDGVYHAVNGNQTGSIGSVTPGGEMWGLILPEFLSKLNRQRANSPELKMPSTPAGINPTPLPKDYFVDGATGVYTKLNSAGGIDTAYIYLTMRRGGRFIYALDVSDPAAPKFLWKKSSEDTGFSELGQTWSRPRVTLLKGYTDSTTLKSKPVLIFGAGYDAAQDDEPPAAADTMGRGIFVLDAATGALVWSASPSGGSTATHKQVAAMTYSIPSDVTFVDRDVDGKTERIYVGDTGGNIWRVDFEPAAGNTSTYWQVNKLAALGCSAGACSSGVPRKFFYPPSVVPVGASGGTDSYDAVLLGSGDREHPLYSTAASSSYLVENQFFMLKDLKTGNDGSGQTTITAAAADLYDATNAALCSSTSNTATTTGLYDGSKKGFRFKFCTGEKSVNAPITLGGSTFFGTNQPTAPAAASCTTNLGIAKSYQVDPFTGAVGSIVLDGGGLPPSPTSVIVTVDNVLSSGCIGCAAILPDTSLCPGCPPPPPPPVKCSPLDASCWKAKVGPRKVARTYWYKD